MGATSYKVGKGKQGSSLYPLDKKKGTTDKANSQNEMLDLTMAVTMLDNLDAWLEVSSFFYNPTQKFISSGVNAAMQQTVGNLLDKGAGPNLINCSFRPPNWHAYFKLVKALLRNAIKQNASEKVLISLHIPMGDLHARSWFDLPGNLAFKVVLGSSYILRCICGLFPTKHKVVKVHSHQGDTHTFINGLVAPPGGSVR